MHPKAVVKASWSSMAMARENSDVSAKLRALANALSPPTSRSRHLPNEPKVDCKLNAHGKTWDFEVGLCLAGWDNEGIRIFITVKAQHGRDTFNWDAIARYRDRWSLHEMLTGGVTTTAVLLVARLTDLLREGSS